MIKLLLVEDDPMLSKSLIHGFSDNGYHVESVANGVEALHLMEKIPYDVVIMDVGLPGMDGIEVLKQTRENKNHLPILLMSAQIHVEQRVMGLNHGADDFVCKPFQFTELEARARALVRRSRIHSTHDPSLGQLRYDATGQCMYWQDKPLDFSSRELTLLAYLLRNPGSLIRKEQIMQDLFHSCEPLSLNAIEVVIHRIRKKLRHTGITVRTKRGLGYSLEFEDST